MFLIYYSLTKSTVFALVWPVLFFIVFRQIWTVSHRMWWPVKPVKNMVKCLTCFIFIFLRQSWTVSHKMWFWEFKNVPSTPGFLEKFVTWNRWCKLKSSRKVFNTIINPSRSNLLLIQNIRRSFCEVRKILQKKNTL